MSTATDTITVTLIHSVGGLMAEITGLPVIAAPSYIRHGIQYELAAEALRARYPNLLIKSSSVEDDQVLFWVEHI
jgi:hypothetical protein